MNAEEVKAIAGAYLAQHPVGNDDYEWLVVEPRRVAEGWYFDFECCGRQDVPKEQWEVFSGAPGFVTAWDGTVRVVGWDELPSALEVGVGAPGDGDNTNTGSSEAKQGGGGGFHVDPMYIV